MGLWTDQLAAGHMRPWSRELEALRQQSLLRTLRTRDRVGTHCLQDGRRLVNFSSNDYLGLAESEEVCTVLTRSIRDHGTGAGASRLVCGSLRPHARLEECLADFKGTEAALTFSTGYAAATGVLPAIAGKGDILILDKLCHASLIDGAKLSGAALRVFPHNNMDRLEHLLRWAAHAAGPDGRVIVVAESIYSMDGDVAPLREMAALKDLYGAAWMLDEAHAFGILGPQGRGLAAAEGVGAKVDIHMGTLSKAAGLSGGFVCGSRDLIDLLINRARSFMYSTAPPPAVAAAAAHVVENILATSQGDALRSRLRANLRLLAGLTGLPEPAAAILPVIKGDEGAAMEAAAALLAAGFLVPGIRFPTVPRGLARLRVTVSARHTKEEIRALAPHFNHQS